MATKDRDSRSRLRHSGCPGYPHSRIRSSCNQQHRGTGLAGMHGDERRHRTKINAKKIKVSFFHIVIVSRSIVVQVGFGSEAPLDVELTAHDDVV